MYRPMLGFSDDHVAHDVKFLAFATAEFRRLEDRRYEVPLQDSALVRGRTLPRATAKS